jgi:dienelactone hydrolase
MAYQSLMFTAVAARFSSIWVVVVIAVLGGLASPVQAQQEFSPPQGKGRVVLVLSGADYAPPYEQEARRIAGLGYDAVLIDSTTVPRDTAADVLRTHIQKALQMPHAQPGKVALVGYSLGGGRALQASFMSDEVAVVIAWYPATTAILDRAGFIRNIRVPILMFAGESDRKMTTATVQCCAIATARALATAAATAGKPFQLVTYPYTDHGFIDGHPNYNPEAYRDASHRMAATLAEYLH